MSYRKLLEKLEAADFSDLEVIGLPDGSVDNYCRIEKGENDYIQERGEALSFIENNPEASLNLIPERVEPGGKSVNMSIQADALGAETAHYGFLDHEVFQKLEFETCSMGEPADVTICEFDDGSLLTARITEELRHWSLDELREFGNLEEILSAELLNCANHSNIKSMTQELEKIAELEPNIEVFNFDPGGLKTLKQEEIKKMFEVLSKISESCEVIVHANSEEAETAAEIYGLEGTKSEKIDKIQEETGVDAYILHDKERAIAGTEEDIIEVENLEAEDLETRTGAGDRFDAAVGLARTAGWNRRESLALGNMSAIHYLEENETGTPEQIREKIREKTRD